MLPALPIILGIFVGETKPIEDRDFIIEWDKKVKGTETY